MKAFVPISNVYPCISGDRAFCLVFKNIHIIPINLIITYLWNTNFFFFTLKTEAINCDSLKVSNLWLQLIFRTFSGDFLNTNSLFPDMCKRKKYVPFHKIQYIHFKNMILNHVFLVFWLWSPDKFSFAMHFAIKYSQRHTNLK